MKRLILLLVLLFPVVLSAAEAQYPWDLSGFVGGASLCDEAGCFGPSGIAFGGSFGRQFTDRWSFELDGVAVRTSEILPGRFDTFTGIFYIPELQRKRFWGGFTFLLSVAKIGDKSNLFVALGAVLAYEHQDQLVPEGVFAPDKTLGLKGGVSGGAGMNLWFSENWGIRPEFRFHGVASPLSGMRYTGGLMYRF